MQVLDLKFKIELVTELKGEVIDCVGDQNGNHVIQKCIECIPSEEIGFLLEVWIPTWTDFHNGSALHCY